MSQRLEEGTRILTSFADLGQIFGIDPLQQDVSIRSDYEEVASFVGLPVIDQLQIARDRYLRKAPLSRELSGLAMKAALEMDPEERTAGGIRLATYVPLDADGRLATPLISNYRVFSLFPAKNIPSYIVSSRLSLQRVFGDGEDAYSPDIVAHIDELVTTEAELRPETISDRYSRYLQEIKALDMVIKQHKLQTVTRRSEYQGPTNNVRLERDTVDRIEKLNLLKDLNVFNYLKTAGDLVELFPYLAPLFEISAGNDNVHTRLSMQQPFEINLDRRLYNPHHKPLFRPGDFINATNLNTSMIQVRRERFLAGSYLDQDRLAYDLLELLHL